MAKGKENANPRSGEESDFEVETIIGRLDKMHYVFLKEVDEIKHSVVSTIAKQRTEFELKIQRKDEQLIRAEKEIEDLNKENEQLKRKHLQLEKCFRRCSVELKRMPLSEMQQEKDRARNCAETVSREQEEITNIPKTGRRNDELSIEASSTFSSSQDILPESTDYLPVYQYKSVDQAFQGNKTRIVSRNDQHLSVPSGSEFPSSAIQQLTSVGDFEPPVAALNSFISSGHSSRHQDIVPEFIDYLPVYKTEDHVVEGEQSSSLELPGPSTDVFNSSEDIQEQEHGEYVPAHGIKVEQLNDEQVFQLADVNTDESSSTQFPPHSVAEQERTGPVMIQIQSEPSSVMTVYQCDICRAHFNCRDLLLHHRKGHGDRTGLKRHKCTQCAYSTDSTDSLRTHLRTHTKDKPYVCETCHKSFTTNGSLTRHTKTHTKEKNYKCDVCNKTFYRNQYLVSHVRTHTKEQPYVCHLCQRTFIQGSHLRYHLRVHH